MKNSIYNENKDYNLQEIAEDFLEGLTEAQAAIMSFDLWQSMIIDGTAPDPNRYEAEVLDFYKDVLAGKHTPFYFMFMGFLGGLDFAKISNDTQESASKY